jgi:hypothetical protein
MQVFWTKRLSSLNTSNMEEGQRRSKRISLPLKLWYTTTYGLKVHI